MLRRHRHRIDAPRFGPAFDQRPHEFLRKFLVSTEVAPEIWTRR